MPTPRFPYDLGRMAISQYFKPTHKAWDIIPLYFRFDGLPADCYPVFSGQTLKFHDDDPVYGKGIKVRTKIWPDLNRYLKTFGVEGENLDILYWHLLDVTDEDGWVDQNTPVGITGNTGYVTSYLYPNEPNNLVPDNMKGVPPYPGLHLHLAAEVDGTPIDPDIIFNYKPMSQIKTQNYKGELRIVLGASKMEEWIALCKVYGVDPNTQDEILT